MATTPISADTSAPSVDDQFFDLICNDVELVAAEFDAIIVAEWPAPPPRPPGRGVAGRQPTGGTARRAVACGGGRSSQPRYPGIGGWARERSPPYRDTTRDT